MLNETHDPALSSWIESANHGHDFPIQNLPLAMLRRRGVQEAYRGGVAIGDMVVDLTALSQSGVVTGTAADPLAACCCDSLNDFMSMGVDAWSDLRLTLSRILRLGAAQTERVRNCMIPGDEVEFALPARIGDYTDFYTSIHHATNIGRLFRPDNPLLPNYHWVPIGYHGRSSSIAVSGQAFPRPIGQTKAVDEAQPAVGPCRRLDYELEVGIFIGAGNALGETVAMSDAEDHVFGLCLLNDWSARDIQAWEYQPLGPFLAKSFATTLSPWIITTEALAPFRKPFSRDPAHSQPLAYLDSPANSAEGALNIELQVSLLTRQMTTAGEAPAVLSTSNFTDAYWTVAQLVTHHTMNGCNLRPGDLFGSGTMSGSAPGSQGALIEITRGGEQPLILPNGEIRTFLEDGDCVIMKGQCERSGATRIGFGEVSGTVLPAVDRHR